MMIIGPFFYLGLVLTRSPHELATLGKLLRSALKGFGVSTLALYVLSGLAYVSGEFARLMLGMSDTAMRLAQSKELAEQERLKAEWAVQSFSKLIVNISHDMRKPIASVLG